MLNIEEIPTAMNDINESKLRVMEYRASSAW